MTRFNDDLRPGGELTLRTLAMPSDANAAGDIFGGWVMAQMDLSCGIAAAERARGRVVTAAVKEMSFAKPLALRHGRSAICLTLWSWSPRQIL
jgi:acyl-CoA thioesterase YciA